MKVTYLGPFADAVLWDSQAGAGIEFQRGESKDVPDGLAGEANGPWEHSDTEVIDDGIECKTDALKGGWQIRTKGRGVLADADSWALAEAEKANGNSK